MLRCDIQPTYGTKRQVIGRATALLRSFGGLNGRGGRASIPIIGSQFEVIGMFNFEFVVVCPFAHPNLSIGSKKTYWKSIATKVCLCLFMIFMH
jgi:glycerophosphodiester phosphodiesterase